MNTAFPNVRSLSGVLIMSMAALVACQSPPPPKETVNAAEAATEAIAMPAPQAPFDTTSITPVESAGAAAE